MPNFSDIIGQDMLKKHLITAVEHDTVSHAYIIVGEKYSGKEFIARIFAAALLCTGEEGHDIPCNNCHSCHQAFSKNNPDIIYVTHDKPGVIGVDDIRTQINEDISIKPYSGRKKIYIVNEAEKMNPQAQNALLKTFEEPPEYAVIILLTTSADELLPTIRSRAVELDMRPVPDAEVKRFLMEEVQIPDYKADVCVAFARGNIGKAKLLASNEDFDNIRRDVINLLKHIREMEISELATAVKKAGEYKLEINDYLDIILVYYRDVLLFKATMDANGLIFKDEIQYIRKAASESTYEGIQNIIAGLEKARERLGANVNFELTMELLFMCIKEN
ncbi:MAG: DNA polymerase III subunit [Lachnospiraceae bacterium]|nr:DNA polymerase III subunit [Lachnospiraceae bacterium]